MNHKLADALGDGAPSDPAAQGDPASGEVRRLDRYELRARIARGRVAEVFLADELGPFGPVRTVTLKALAQPGPVALRHFLEEITRTAEMQHPNIVTTFGFGSSGGEHFLALEHIRGASVRELIDALGPLPIAAALAIASAVAKALAYLDERSDPSGAPAPVAHRGISPDNILVSASGAVKIIDFGSALPEGVRPAGAPHERLSYAAPEQVAGGRADVRSDLWSLGTVLYEMLTGIPPFEDPNPGELIRAQEEHGFLPVEQLRPDALALSGLIERALEPHLGRRWPSARDLDQAIGAVARRYPDRSAQVLARLVADAWTSAGTGALGPDFAPPFADGETGIADAATLMANTPELARTAAARSRWRADDRAARSGQPEATAPDPGGLGSVTADTAPGPASAGGAGSWTRAADAPISADPSFAADLAYASPKAGIADAATTLDPPFADDPRFAHGPMPIDLDELLLAGPVLAPPVAAIPAGRPPFAEGIDAIAREVRLSDLFSDPEPSLQLDLSTADDGEGASSAIDLVALGASEGVARPPPPRAAARPRPKRGARRLLAALGLPGRWAKALAAFGISLFLTFAVLYAALPSPRLREAADALAALGPARIQRLAAGMHPGGSARLSIVASPPAHVEVDGVPIGPTPLATSDIPAGPHRVALIPATGGFATLDLPIELRSGAETSLKVDFTKDQVSERSIDTPEQAPAAALAEQR